MCCLGLGLLISLFVADAEYKVYRVIWGLVVYRGEKSCKGNNRMQEDFQVKTVCILLIGNTKIMKRQECREQTLHLQRKLFVCGCVLLLLSKDVRPSSSSSKDADDSWWLYLARLPSQWLTLSFKLKYSNWVASLFPLSDYVFEKTSVALRFPYHALLIC